MSPEFARFFLLSEKAAHLTEQQKTALYSVLHFSDDLAMRYDVFGVLKDETPFETFAEEISIEMMQVLKLLSDSDIVRES